MVYIFVRKAIKKNKPTRAYTCGYSPSLQLLLQRAINLKALFGIIVQQRQHALFTPTYATNSHNSAHNGRNAISSLLYTFISGINAQHAITNSLHQKPDINGYLSLILFEWENSSFVQNPIKTIAESIKANQACETKQICACRQLASCVLGRMA